jgi:hypothetical protein
MLFGVADAEPEARKIERRAFDFLEFEHVAVEAAGALKVVYADQDVMKVRFIHEFFHIGDLLPSGSQRYQDQGRKYTVPFRVPIDVPPLTS